MHSSGYFYNMFSSIHPTCQASEASLEAAKLAMRAVLTGAEELKQVTCGEDELEVLGGSSQLVRVQQMYGNFGLVI